MANELLSIESIELVGGVNSVNLNFDRGLSGQRGSYIIAWLGNPNDITFPITASAANGPVYPQTSDWFINMQTTDDDYLCVYQLKLSGVWEFIFKLIPNVYNVIKPVTFTAGMGNTLVSVSENNLILKQLYGDMSVAGSMDIPDVSESVDSEAELLALTGMSVGEYAYRTDLSQFFKVVSTPTNTLKAWTGELSINLKMDFENFKPVASTFIINKPYTSIETIDTVDIKFYHFPITIIAAEADPTTGWGPMSGSKSVHLGISVI